MSLCTVTNIVQSAAVEPSGGGPDRASQAISILWTVTAELKGYDTPPNDGTNLVDQVYPGTVVRTPIIITGFLAGYKDTAAYTVAVPFIDQLFQGANPLTPPFSGYYLITETYMPNLFPVQPGASQGQPLVVTRKIRPLSAGGPVQPVSAILV